MAQGLAGVTYQQKLGSYADKTTRVAALVFEPCAGFQALAQDAAPTEQAYARYLAGQALVADAALLPEAQRPLALAAQPPAPSPWRSPLKTPARPPP